MSDADQNRRIQEFMSREFSFNLTAGECNFLIQLLAFVVQENPSIVRGPKGEKEELNYQSIRSIVLMNEKLSQQLQQHAKDASIVMGEVRVQTDKVQ
ncbi:MAG: hypothetical protein WAO20_05375 [Acidobacteriota bacterium]